MPAAADALLKALADPTRRAIFERLCRGGEQTLRVLTEHSGVSQPAVSRHLGVLKLADPVPGRHEGRQTDSGARPEARRRFNVRATPMPQRNGVTDCQVLVVEPNERLSYSWDLSREATGKVEDRGHLDAHADEGPRSRPDGAVGLPARRRGQPPGRERWLAAVSRGPGAGGCWA